MILNFTNFTFEFCEFLHPVLFSYFGFGIGSCIWIVLAVRTFSVKIPCVENKNNNHRKCLGEEVLDLPH